MKLRIFTGGIIALHGLLRIVYIEKYINFVHENFLDVIPSHTLLTISSAIFPFIEFFAGLLILSNVKLKKSIIFGASISIVMSLFILLASKYERLIYHGLVMLFLSLVYWNMFSTNKRRKVI